MSDNQNLPELLEPFQMEQGIFFLTSMYEHLYVHTKTILHNTKVRFLTKETTTPFQDKTSAPREGIGAQRSNFHIELLIQTYALTTKGRSKMSVVVASCIKRDDEYCIHIIDTLCGWWWWSWGASRVKKVGGRLENHRAKVRLGRWCWLMNVIMYSGTIYPSPTGPRRCCCCCCSLLSPRPPSWV